MFARLISLFLLLTTLVSAIHPVMAQNPFAPSKPETKEEENQESPRFMMKNFIEILNNSEVDTAFRYVEFPRGISLDARRAIIGDLIEVLNKRGNIDLPKISNNPSGDLSDNTDPNLETIGTIVLGKNSIPVVLRYSEDKNRKGWRFSIEFMEQIPLIAAALHSSGLESKLPPKLIQHGMFGVKLWQWIGLLIVIGLSILSSLILASGLLLMMRWISSRLKVVVPSDILTSFVTPLRLFAGILVFSYLCELYETSQPLKVPQPFPST
ncbi:MAG: hypothetical protein EOP10_34545, partial [Proteobacteria bacterium]